MKYTNEDELEAKGEYLQMVNTFLTSSEFQTEWRGHWEDEEEVIFGQKNKKIIKGDKAKYMKYWLETQKIINDKNWNTIGNEEDEYIY